MDQTEIRHAIQTLTIFKQHIENGTPWSAQCQEDYNRAQNFLLGLGADQKPDRSRHMGWDIGDVEHHKK